MLDLNSLTTHRRGFLGRLAAGAAALGLGGLVAPIEAAAERGVAPRAPANPEFEAWLNKILGKHKINIADFSLGRGAVNDKQNAPRRAIAVVHVDGRVPEEVLAELRKVPAIDQAKAIRLY